MTEADTCREFVTPRLVEAGLEHADPKDLIASMRGHETEIMRLLGKIEALVNGVQS